MVRVEDVTLTYAQLERDVNQLACVFDDFGLARGDPIAALLPNTAFVIVVAWAAYRRGRYFTPVSTALSTPDAAYIMANCQARLVIAQEPAKAAIAELPAFMAGTIQWLSHGDGIAGLAPLAPLMARQLDGPSDQECPGALMLYTSGTTGFPKGVWRPLPDAAYTGPPTFAADLLPIVQLDADSR